MFYFIWADLKKKSLLSVGLHCLTKVLRELIYPGCKGQLNRDRVQNKLCETLSNASVLLYVYVSFKANKNLKITASLSIFEGSLKVCSGILTASSAV